MEYEEKTFFIPEGQPCQVVVSFECSYHDWQKIQSSEEWKCLCDLVDQVETKKGSGKQWKKE